MMAAICIDRMRSYPSLNKLKFKESVIEQFNHASVFTMAPLDRSPSLTRLFHVCQCWVCITECGVYHQYTSLIVKGFIGNGSAIGNRAPARVPENRRFSR
jgi:hypothetical protein